MSCIRPNRRVWQYLICHPKPCFSIVNGNWVMQYETYFPLDPTETQLARSGIRWRPAGNTMALDGQTRSCELKRNLSTGWNVLQYHQWLLFWLDATDADSFRRRFLFIQIRFWFWYYLYNYVGKYIERRTTYIDNDWNCQLLTSTVSCAINPKCQLLRTWKFAIFGHNGVKRASFGGAHHHLQNRVWNGRGEAVCENR